MSIHAYAKTKTSAFAAEFGSLHSGAVTCLATAGIGGTISQLTDTSQGSDIIQT